MRAKGATATAARSPPLSLSNDASRMALETVSSDTALAVAKKNKIPRPEPARQHVDTAASTSEQHPQLDWEMPEAAEEGSSPSAMLSRMVDDQPPPDDQPPSGRSRKKANADTGLEDGDGYDFVKGPWTTREDELLTQMVQTHGTTRWSLVASSVKGRTGKQCRERWTNQLNPLINKRPWSTEEDEVRAQ